MAILLFQDYFMFFKDRQTANQIQLLSDTFVLDKLNGKQELDMEKMSKDDLRRLAINDYINSRNN